MLAFQLNLCEVIIEKVRLATPSFSGGFQPFHGPRQEIDWPRQNRRRSLSGKGGLQPPGKADPPDRLPFTERETREPWKN
jgi:hypothetical protein